MQNNKQANHQLQQKDNKKAQINTQFQDIQKKIHTQMLFMNKQLTSAPIKGYDFNNGIDYQKLFKSYATTGLQAYNLSKAIDIVNQMISWRLSDDPLNSYDDQQTSQPQYRKNYRCNIFLGYTSNMASCGVRDIIRYLAQHKMIDCIVTTTGGIEEDLMKTLGNFHMGDYAMDDKQNRLSGHCRIGNILVPNENYIKLQSFLLPLFHKMYQEQEKDKINWTPRLMIERFGKEINNQESIYYWCYKNNIPVYCPALTDGAIGDVLFTNSFKNDLRLDIIQDAKQLNKMAMKSKKSGVIVLGGSIPKHHILNAHIWRNGADYGVFINTGIYEDGSDSGAKISEAFTWGKMRLDAKYSKIYSQATLVFPILVAETFAKRQKQASKLQKK